MNEAKNTNKDESSVGERIRISRIDRHLTLAGAAMVLNTNASALSRIENNSQDPSCGLLIMMSKEFNVSIDYLLLGNKDSNSDIIDLSGMSIRAANAFRALEVELRHHS